jgi:hypothetical protein
MNTPIIINPVAADVARENWTPIDQSAADEGAAIIQLDVLRPRRRRLTASRGPSIDRNLLPSVTIDTRKVKQEREHLARLTNLLGGARMNPDPNAQPDAPNRPRNMDIEGQLDLCDGEPRHRKRFDSLEEEILDQQRREAERWNR